MCNIQPMIFVVNGTRGNLILYEIFPYKKLQQRQHKISGGVPLYFSNKNEVCTLVTGSFFFPPQHECQQQLGNILYTRHLFILQHSYCTYIVLFLFILSHYCDSCTDGLQLAVPYIIKKTKHFVGGGGWVTRFWIFLRGRGGGFERGGVRHTNIDTGFSFLRGTMYSLYCTVGFARGGFSLFFYVFIC
jgi:hypothetical protein